MEGTENRVELSRDEQLRILTRLTDAVIFEEFIQKKFVGAKSFSLEGAESLIPLLDLAIEKAGDAGHRRDRAGHGPSRPAERAGQHHGQEPAGRSSASSRTSIPKLHMRPRRREVSPGLQHATGSTAAGHEGAPVAVLQPQPPGVRQSRWRWAACAPSRTASAITQRERGMAMLIHGDAAFAGEGDRAGDAQPEPARRLHSRRHAARRRQQPDRLHHRARRRRARAPMPPTWPRCCRSRSSTSTAKIPRPWPRWCGWRWTSAASSSATS